MGADAPRWGWHRLDDRWATRLVAEARLPAHALVLDVGAGTGAITAALREAGHRVVAIEAHAGRAAHLRTRFADDDALIVVRADAGDLRLPRRPYHVVANPPFALTSVLLRRLLQPGSRLQTATLVLQHQAARRWCGEGAPAIARWGRAFASELGPVVPRQAFHPAPPVPARVLLLRRRCDVGAPGRGG